MDIQYGKVLEVDNTKTTMLPHPILDAKTGGNVVTLDTQKYVPRDTLYRVRVLLDAPPQQLHMETSDAVIEGQRSAWLPAVFKRIAAVLVRESGF